MGGLARRVQILERRYRPGPRDPCPEHLPSLTPMAGDVGSVLRKSLRAFSPNDEDRQAYQAEQEALAATPPCRICGWQPFVVFVRPAESWGQLGPGDGDAG
jgi:hypothetical protein